MGRKSPSMMRVLGVFAKGPRAGGVKTRLGTAPGDDWGARAAHAFLADTLARLAGVADRRVIAFAPPESEREFVAYGAGRYVLVPQGAGDLGRRMERFVAAEFAAGAGAVVLVGADSPTLPVSFIEEAFARLRTADVVLGPAADGGYYLVGCRPPVPPIFTDIAWGTAGVLEATVARARDGGLSLAVLPPWYDVDTPDGWAMLRGHVAALRCAGTDPGVPYTEELIRETKKPCV